MIDLPICQPDQMMAAVNYFNWPIGRDKNAKMCNFLY